VNLDDFVAEQLATDPEFREVYERERARYELRNALIKARVDAGLTQKELAERLGVSQPVIARLESGGRFPNVETLMRLAAVLGVAIVITGDALEVRPGKAA
jgi:transcriptional regulator with XRE-family HTH domain